jgi:hypothetical protein
MVTEQLTTRKQLFIIGVLTAFLASGCDNAVATPPMTPSPRATATFIAEPSPMPPPLLAFEILGMNYYEDPVGSLRFLLEVRNMNHFDVEGVRAAVFLQDADGQIVDSQYGYAKLDILRRGDTAPIMVVFFLEAPEFSTYDIEIEGQEADYMAALLHPDLRIADDFGRVGQWVPYEVLGEVQNVGDWDAKSITLVVTCYDVDGKVVAVGTGRPAERAIPAGSSSDFLVSVGAVAGEIASCKVQVEGLIANYD